MVISIRLISIISIVAHKDYWELRTLMGRIAAHAMNDHQMSTVGTQAYGDADNGKL
jgi:hypothetical protein